MVFQIFIVESLEPLAKVPFFKSAIHLTQPSCPINVLTGRPLFVFHKIIDLSHEPLASKPFSSTARDHT